MSIRFLPVAAAGLCLGMCLIALRNAGGAATTQIVDKLHCQAYLSTDKPIYRDGEGVYLRAVVLGADDHRPMPDDQPAMATLQITGPKGEILFNSWAQSEQSVAAMNWRVPADAAGGTYKAKVEFPQFGFPPAERKFEVRAYRAPRLKGEIIFLRDGYGPGDTVRASLHVERAEGGLPAGASVNARAIVDGADVYRGATKIDAAGNCAVEFALPAKIDKGDGALSLAIADGGVVEPISKTIPILVNSVNVQMYPEGGDLVAGLENRVYLEARLPSQKPADLVGTIVDSQGKVIADVRTEHEGRGRFGFTPVNGEQYSLKVSQPAGISKTFALPEVKSAGVVVQAEQDVYAKNQPVKLKVASTMAGDYVITLSKHETELSSLKVNLAAGEPREITLTPPASADGVLIATVTDKAMPVAERLIFRQSEKGVHISIKADRASYVPTDSATLTINTTDDDGKPIGAMVGITVTDQSVLQMIEKRERAPRLPAMVMLEDDVRELTDADVYLDSSNDKAAMATDLLLGTQGWRRFAMVDTAKFLASAGDAGRRVVADLQPQPESIGLFGGGMGGGRAFHGQMAFAMENRAMAENGVEHEAAAMPQGAVAIDRLDKALERQAPAEDQDALLPQDRRLVDAASPVMMMPVIRPVRIYAHDLAAGHRPGERSDFTETLYWCAGVKTDAATGVGTVSFKLNDSVTTFAALADGFTDDGRIGSGQTTVSSIKPLYVEPKLPLEVTAGDVMHLPISFVNGTTDAMKSVKVSISTPPGISASAINEFALDAQARDRHSSDVIIGGPQRGADITIHADAGAYHDDVTRHLVVEPSGFPTSFSKGGLLGSNSSVSHEVEIPATLIDGSVVATASLYPTPMGNLTEALKRLMQEPNGCFEQTTSTNYPLVMADQYFIGHTGVDPAIIAQTSQLLDKGYNRLIGFECANKGFEWFGEDPGHECLSAYGLMEFTDMAQVRNVDQKMLEDTRNWLLARRDGNGGYSHERRSLHTWVTDPDCANGYCTWALLECGQTHLEKEVSWLKDHAMRDPNSYVTALAANVMVLAGDKDAAKLFMDELAGEQDKDGHVLNAVTSVVASEGESLQIETTALATLAWLRDPAYAGNVEQAIHFLADSCEGGRYGSTQSTVLALRAIIAYDKARAHPTAAGSVQLIVDDKPIGGAMAFDEHSQGAIKLPDFADLMTVGKHTVGLKMTDGSALPFALAVNFNGTIPASSDQCKLSITTQLKDEQVTEGSITEADVTVANRTEQIVPTPIAIIGLPGGLEVRYEQLKELVKAKRIAAYEVRGREVILYWREMQPREAVQIPLSVVAAVPGIYTGPASRAYLYYSDEYKQWSGGMKVRVEGR